MPPSARVSRRCILHETPRLLGGLQTAHCSADDPNTNAKLSGERHYSNGTSFEQTGSESSTQKSSLLSFQIIPSGRVHAQPVCKLSFIRPYAPWNETKLINISNAPRDTLKTLHFPLEYGWGWACAACCEDAFTLCCPLAATSCLFGECEHKGAVPETCYQAEPCVLGHSVAAAWKQSCPDTHEPCQRPPCPNKRMRSCSIQPTIFLRPEHGKPAQVVNVLVSKVKNNMSRNEEDSIVQELDVLDCVLHLQAWPDTKRRYWCERWPAGKRSAGSNRA